MDLKDKADYLKHLENYKIGNDDKLNEEEIKELDNYISQEKGRQHLQLERAKASNP